MSRYIGKRLLLIIPILLGVIFIVFTINQLTPGDPVAGILGNNYTQAQYDAKSAELGLDKPFFTQFFIYLKNIVTKFDFGTSYKSGRSVTTEMLQRFPTTFILAILSVLVTVIIGLPFGIASATKQYSALDYTVTSVAMFFASMPSFWMAMMMMLIFSLNLNWLPASGVDTWKGWVLPTLALGLSPVATVTRITRSSMLDVVRQDYIRTARAKGLGEGEIIRKHALPNALIPVITVVGMQLGYIIAGSVVIEAIFAIPGIGSWIMTAISQKDYPVIQGSVLFLSLIICLLNLLVDLIYGFVDPRIKAQYISGGKTRKAKKTMEDEVA